VNTDIVLAPWGKYSGAEISLKWMSGKFFKVLKYKPKPIEGGNDYLSLSEKDIVIGTIDSNVDDLLRPGIKLHSYSGKLRRGARLVVGYGSKKKLKHDNDNVELPRYFVDPRRIDYGGIESESLLERQSLKPILAFFHLKLKNGNGLPIDYVLSSDGDKYALYAEKRENSSFQWRIGQDVIFIGSVKVENKISGKVLTKTHTRELLPENNLVSIYNVPSKIQVEDLEIKETKRIESTNLEDVISSLS